MHERMLMYSTCAWEDIWTRLVTAALGQGGRGVGCTGVDHSADLQMWHHALIFDEQVQIFMTTPLS